MPELTLGQYDLVHNMFSFTIATMFASFVFFILARSQVSKKYHGALLMSALIVFIAGYHYFRIFESWEAAYQLTGSMYVPSGEPFNDAYRYVDWLLTVPLLLAELIAVLRLPKGGGALATKLIVAALLMIITGYPGEIATDITTRAVWGFISTIPFVYILYVLWVELSDAIERQPGHAKVLVRNIRYLLLATWGFYPIAYLMPMIGLQGATGMVALQVGYTIADVLAKAAYGLMIYWIALEKTRAEEGAEETASAAAPAS